MSDTRTAEISCGACGSTTANSNMIYVNAYIRKIEHQLADKDKEIERLRGALESIAHNPEFNPFAGSPEKWPSTIAQQALQGDKE